MSKTADKFTFKHEQITEFLTKILELGQYLHVHDDGLITPVTNPDEPYYMTDKTNDTVQRKLYVYRTDIKDPDALIMNPINELVSVSKEKLWFYQSISTILSITYNKVMQVLIQVGVKIKTGEETGDPVLLSILSSNIDDLDDKTFNEYKKVFDGASAREFMNIYYDKAHKTSKLRVCFQNKTDDFKNAFGSKVRKKSWALFSRLTNAIFHVDEDKTLDDVYVKTTERLDYPQFETYMTVWLRAWKALAPFFPYIFDAEVANATVNDLNIIEKHMDHIDVYRQKSGWYGQSASKDSEIVNAKSLDVPRSRRQTEDNNNNVRVYEGDFVRRNDDTSRPAFREPEPVPSGRNRFEQPNEPPKRKSPLEVLGLDDDRRYRDDFYNSRSRSRDYYRDPRDFRPREPARDFHRDEPKADWERSLEAYQKERSYNSSVPPWSDDRRYRW
jgi:hypothetical protein